MSTAPLSFARMMQKLQLERFEAVTFSDNILVAPLSLSCHVMSFCEWTMSCGGIITSRRHIGRTSFLFFISASFFCWLLFCWGWHLSGRVFFWLWQTARIIQCPLGVRILFIMYALFHYCCSKTACVVRIQEWLSDECSLVCTNTDSSGGRCFRFSSILLNSIRFDIPLQRFCDLLPATS